MPKDKSRNKLQHASEKGIQYQGIPKVDAKPIEQTETGLETGTPQI